MKTARLHLLHSEILATSGAKERRPNKEVHSMRKLAKLRAELKALGFSFRSGKGRATRSGPTHSTRTSASCSTAETARMHTATRQPVYASLDAGPSCLGITSRKNAVHGNKSQNSQMAAQDQPAHASGCPALQGVCGALRNVLLRLPASGVPAA
jgi:hypothetical protein